MKQFKPPVYCCGKWKWAKHHDYYNRDKEGYMRDKKNQIISKCPYCGKKIKKGKPYVDDASNWKPKWERDSIRRASGIAWLQYLIKEKMEHYCNNIEICRRFCSNFPWCDLKQKNFYDKYDLDDYIENCDAFMSVINRAEKLYPY